MRNDVHLASLRAAARVAFSVAFIGGCAAPVTAGSGSTTSNLDEGGKKAVQKDPVDAVPCDTSDDDSADAAVTTASTPPDESTPPDTTPPPPPRTPVDGTCDDVLASTFPTVSDYPGTKASSPISEVAVACCKDELLSTTGAGEHRWDCCANVDQQSDNSIAMACTPWGPPVPPSMTRRRSVPSAPKSRPTPWAENSMTVGWA